MRSNNHGTGSLKTATHARHVMPVSSQRSEKKVYNNYLHVLLLLTVVMYVKQLYGRE